VKVILEAGLTLQCLIETDNGERSLKSWPWPHNDEHRMRNLREGLDYANELARVMGCKRTFRELFT